MGRVLVIGDPQDPHVSAVVTRLPSSEGAPLVVDAATLSTLRWRYHGGVFSIYDSDRRWRAATRGWLRRLAPAGHHAGVPLGSRQAAEAGARLALVAGLEVAGIAWLTDYWSMTRAENKLVQYHAADTLGIRVPATAVVSHRTDLGVDLGDPLIVKPLGVGYFQEDGVAHAVHTQLVQSDDPRLDGMAEAPFLVQRHIAAVEHLRVVTVADRAWTARLAADALPTDWRAAPQAHTSWESDHQPQVEMQATSLAQTLSLGYSSQDWIVDAAGDAWFLDINPGGQWLFLPSEVSDSVSDAVANWLATPSADT